jgi:hypothetical protein
METETQKKSKEMVNRVVREFSEKFSSEKHPTTQEDKVSMLEWLNDAYKGYLNAFTKEELIEIHANICTELTIQEIKKLIVMEHIRKMKGL